MSDAPTPPYDLHPDVQHDLEQMNDKERELYGKAARQLLLD